MPESFGGFCYDENNCGFRALLGDAGGTYVAEPIIHNQVATRTVLASVSGLIRLFRKNISPTRYHHAALRRCKVLFTANINQ